MYRFVIRKRYMDLLIGLEDKQETVRDLSKRINENISYLSIRISKFEDEGIIKKIKNKKHRAQHIVLTEKGIKIVTALRILKKVIDGG